MNQDERKKLKKYLRRGDANKIAAAAKMTRHTVYRWFEGDYENSAVEPYIMKLIDKRKEEIEQSLNSL